MHNYPVFIKWPTSVCNGRIGDNVVTIKNILSKVFEQNSTQTVSVNRRDDGVTDISIKTDIIIDDKYSIEDVFWLINADDQLKRDFNNTEIYVLDIDFVKQQPKAAWKFNLTNNRNVRLTIAKDCVVLFAELAEKIHPDQLTTTVAEFKDRLPSPMIPSLNIPVVRVSYEGEHPLLHQLNCIMANAVHVDVLKYSISGSFDSQSKVEYSRPDGFDMTIKNDVGLVNRTTLEDIIRYIAENKPKFRVFNVAHTEEGSWPKHAHVAEYVSCIDLSDDDDLLSLRIMGDMESVGVNQNPDRWDDAKEIYSKARQLLLREPGSWGAAPASFYTVPYTRTYSVGYDKTIVEFIPDIGEDDKSYLADLAVELYNSLSDDCSGVLFASQVDDDEEHIDNFRVSRYDDNQWSDAYGKAIEQGCCDEVDNVVTNPSTGNTFIMGFNYSH